MKTRVSLFYILSLAYFSVCAEDINKIKVDSILKEVIYCFQQQDVHRYMQLYPSGLQFYKALKTNYAKNASREMLLQLNFQTYKATIQDFLINQRDAYELSINWNNLRCIKNQIQEAEELNLQGQKIQSYEVYTLLRDTANQISYVMQSSLNFLPVDIFGGITVEEFKRASSIESFLSGEKKEADSYKNENVQIETKVINMDSDDGHVYYYKKAYTGTIGKDTGSLALDYRNEWGSDFIDGAHYLLSGQQDSTEISTGFIDTVSSYYEEGRDITWLIMEINDLLLGYLMYQNGEVLDEIKMKRKD